MAQSIQSILDIHLTPWCPKLRHGIPNCVITPWCLELRHDAPDCAIWFVMMPRIAPWCPKLRLYARLRHFGKYSFWHLDCAIRFVMMSQIAPWHPNCAMTPQIAPWCPKLRHSIRHDAQNCAMISPIAPLRHFGKYSFWHLDCAIRFVMMSQIAPFILRHCPKLRQCPKCSKCWILHCAMMPKIAPCRIWGNDYLIILIILIEIAVIR